MNHEIACRVFAWLTPLTPVFDHTEMHLPILRKPEVTWAIADAVSEESDPGFWAGVLDVWGALETAYSDIGGACPGVEPGTPCPREQAQTCGVWMTLCSRTPRDLVGQARVALQMFHESERACPSFPFGLYAGGECRAYDVVDDRLRHVRAELGLEALP